LVAEEEHQAKPYDQIARVGTKNSRVTQAAHTSNSIFARLHQTSPLACLKKMQLRLVDSAVKVRRAVRQAREAVRLNHRS
jgi:hypothetical protein